MTRKSERELTKRVLLWMLLIQMMSAQPQLWYQKQSGNIGPAMSVAVNAQGGIFASVYNKGIYRSLDTGATWTQIAPYTDGVWSIAVRKSGEMIAGLWSKGVFRSTDNGTTWNPLPQNLLHADVRAVSGDSEIVVESEGKMLRSTNNGSEWKQLHIGAGVAVISGDTIIAAKGKMVYRSNDHGKQWTVLTELSSSVYALSVGNDGNIMVGTFFDEFLKAPSFFSYNDSINMWKGSGPPSSINSLARNSGGTLFAASHDSGFYSSVNNGLTWKRFNTGLSTTKIYSITLLFDTIVVAGTLDGIFITRGLSNILSVETEDQKPVILPDHFSLEQNFPNPFNPSTTISFSVPSSGHVSLRVYDLLGRETALLVNETKNAGQYSIPFDASSLSSGAYFYSLRSGNSSETKRMLLVR